MAFQTNHTAPSGFTAGAQLKDGSSLGTWLWLNIGAGTGTLLVTLRARKLARNDRFAVEEKLGSGDWRLVGRESLRAYAEQAPPTAADNAAPDVTKTYTNIQAWIDYVATQAELNALGLTTGAPIPVLPNSFLINFVQDADGKVKPYYEPIDPAKQQQELNDLLKTSLMSSVVTGTGTNGEVTTGSGSMTTGDWVRVGLVGALIGLIIYGAAKLLGGKK